MIATQVSLMLTSQPSPTAMPTLPGSTSTAAGSAATPTGSPTAIATETSLATPTATPAGVTSTPLSTDPAVYLGPPTGKDTLDTGKNFGLENQPYDDDYTYIRIENGALVMTSRYASDYHGWRTGGVKLQDAYIQATVQVGDCSGADMYGLIVRSPDYIKGYWFQVTCDGNWIFGYWDGENEVDLKSGNNSSNAILTGSNQTNRLGVMAKGDDFKLFVNGQQIGEVTDSKFPDAGSYGMLISARNTPNFTTSTDEFDYWTLN